MSNSRNNMPCHVAIVMDGNGRWAIQRNLDRTEGHVHGISAVDELMNLMRTAITDRLDEFMDANIKLRVCGNMAQCPEAVQAALQHAIDAAATNTGMVVTLYIAYNGRQEICDAVNRWQASKRAAVDTKSPVDQLCTIQDIDAHMQHPHTPAPDMFIRTSEMRLSGFMPWYLGYTELFFIDKLWPDVTESDFAKCLFEYVELRHRRFGAILPLH